MIKDSFLTVAYKQGFIHTHTFRWLNGRSSLRVDYTPKDGLGMMPAKRGWNIHWQYDEPH